MEALAKKFEQDEDISQDVEQKSKEDTELLIQKTNPSVQDRYIPYSEVSSDKNIICSCIYEASSSRVSLCMNSCLQFSCFSDQAS